VCGRNSYLGSRSCYILKRSIERGEEVYQRDRSFILYGSAFDVGIPLSVSLSLSLLAALAQPVPALSLSKRNGIVHLGMAWQRSLNNEFFYACTPHPFVTLL